MKLGNYELRKPWVKMVDVPFEEEVYDAVRASIVNDIMAEIKADNDYAIKLIKTYKSRS